MSRAPGGAQAARPGPRTAAEAMERIGILGGIGPESSAEYYRRITRAFAGRKGGLEYPEIVLFSANMREVGDLVEAGDLPGLAAWILDKLRVLHGAGAAFGAIASNTPHIVFDEVSSRSPIPLVSIVEATLGRARSLGVRRAGLFGTRLTMEADFFVRAFAAAGIEIAVPHERERRLIHHLIFAEIELGVFKDETREELLAVAGRMVGEDGIDALILGCTELPLLLAESRFGIPFLDTTAIHCDAIVARSVGAPG